VSGVPRMEAGGTGIMDHRVSRRQRWQSVSQPCATLGLFDCQPLGTGEDIVVGGRKSTRVNLHMGRRPLDKKASYVRLRSAGLPVFGEDQDDLDGEPSQPHAADLGPEEPDVGAIRVYLNDVFLRTLRWGGPDRLHDATRALPGMTSGPPVPGGASADERREDLAVRLKEHLKWIGGGRERASAYRDVMSGGVWLSAIEVIECLPSRRRRAILRILGDRPDLHVAVFWATLFWPFWIRDIGDWRVPDRPRDEMIESLVDHLFARYPVPTFLYREWFYQEALPSIKLMCWFILIGQGASLHRASRVMGWNVPKTLAPILPTVPRQERGVYGCIWAEVARLGGTDSVFRQIIRSAGFVLDPFAPERAAHAGTRRFWQDTVKWFIGHRTGLNDEDADTILGWAMHMWTEACRRGPEPESGCLRFNWGDLSPERARRLARAYYQQLWSNVPEEEWATRGWDWRSGTVDGGGWEIVELVTGAELVEESAAMHHCVRTYARRCAAGQSAIFSARRAGQRILTIEVDPMRREIVQVRGSCNRQPDANEEAVVRRWYGEVVKRPLGRAGGTGQGGAPDGTAVG